MATLGRQAKRIYQLDPLGKKQRREHGGAGFSQNGQLAQCFPVVMPLFLSYPMSVNYRSQSRKWSQMVGESTKRSSRTDSASFLESFCTFTDHLAHSLWG